MLGGGAPRGRVYLVEGEPGSGKTTLGLQFLLAGAAAGERCLCVTLSESEEELRAIAASHGWDLSGIEVLDLQSAMPPHGQSNYTILQPSEVELGELTRGVIERIDAVRPTRVCFDSLSEVRLLARDPLRFRREVLAIKGELASRGGTAMLLDYRSDPAEIQSLVHGVVSLEHVPIEFGADRRRLSVRKLRGSPFRGGYHDYRIRTGGIDVFPRIVAAESRGAGEPQPYPSGLAGLDQLLGGGIGTGTCTMLLGPSGTGKSALASAWALEAARRGDKAVVFLFDEAPATWTARLRSLSLAPDEHLRHGRIELVPIDPAEVSPGEFGSLVQRHLDGGVRVVVLDSINGYLNAMPSVDFLGLHLHELLHLLRNRDAVTLLTLAQHGILGQRVQSPVELSYMADTVLLLRYFEAFGEVRKALSVMKKRHGAHESTIRELRLSTGEGIVVGGRLTEFQGVLGGSPRYVGTAPPARDEADA